MADGHGPGRHHPVLGDLLHGNLHSGGAVGASADPVQRGFLHGRTEPGGHRHRFRRLFQHHERLRIRGRAGSGLPHGNELPVDGDQRPHGHLHLLLPVGEAHPAAGRVERVGVAAGRGSRSLQEPAYPPADLPRHPVGSDGLPGDADSGHGHRPAGHHRQYSNRPIEPGSLCDRVVRSPGVLLRHRRHHRLGLYRRDSRLHYGDCGLAGAGGGHHRRSGRLCRHVTDHWGRRPRSHQSLGIGGSAGVPLLVFPLYPGSLGPASRDHQADDEQAGGGCAAHSAHLGGGVFADRAPLAGHRPGHENSGAVGQPSRTSGDRCRGAPIPAGLYPSAAGRPGLRGLVRRHHVHRRRLPEHRLGRHRPRHSPIPAGPVSEERTALGPNGHGGHCPGGIPDCRLLRRPCGHPGSLWLGHLCGGPGPGGDHRLQLEAGHRPGRQHRHDLQPGHQSGG